MAKAGFRKAAIPLADALRCHPGGRSQDRDRHARQGLNQIMIDMAAKTGMPVKAGAKYSAEHQSLG
jgi:hypothetical protein